MGALKLLVPTFFAFLASVCPQDVGCMFISLSLFTLAFPIEMSFSGSKEIPQPTSWSHQSFWLAA